MNNKIMIVGIMSIVLMVFFAGCTKAGTTAPPVSSENVETASSSVESTAGDFVTDATPASEQVVPDLT